MAVLETIAPIFFEHGYSALEAACHSIAAWYVPLGARADVRPDPEPDASLELPLLTSILEVKMPDSTEAPQVRKTGPMVPDRPRAVCPPYIQELTTDSGIFAPLVPITSFCNHLAIAVVYMGMLDIG